MKSGLKFPQSHKIKIYTHNKIGIQDSAEEESLGKKKLSASLEVSESWKKSDPSRNLPILWSDNKPLVLSLFNLRGKTANRVTLNIKLPLFNVQTKFHIKRLNVKCSSFLFPHIGPIRKNK